MSSLFLHSINRDREESGKKPIVPKKPNELIKEKIDKEKRQAIYDVIKKNAFPIASLSLTLLYFIYKTRKK